MIKINKKAQGLSMETIIVAILVLLAVFILILIFTGGMSKVVEFLTEREKCENQGENAYCIDEGERCAGIKMGRTNCEKDQVCCIPSGTG